MAEKRENAVRALRVALGWNQTKFATELGMSIASIQNYERGMSPSEHAIVKMQNLAASNGLEELGFALVPGNHSITTVFMPGSPRPRLPKSPRGKHLGDSLHETLDAIIENADAETVAAVAVVLDLARRNIGGKK
jgi:transcriptional regulator with XRE-family HTH domain